MAINEKYSYKDWFGLNLTTKPASDFNDSEIVGACFSQDNPHTDVFPAGVVSLTFTRCNLDNCNIPAGAILNRTSNNQWKYVDGEQMVVDINDDPIDTLEHHLNIAFWRMS